MKKYFVTVRVQDMTVMADTIEVASANEARETIRDRFLSDPDNLRASIASMDDLNRKHAERMLELMMETRHKAIVFGMSITARPSKAKS